MGKGMFFWASGIGFSAMQIFLFLESRAAKIIFIGFVLLTIWIFSKTPKEMRIVYWIMMTVVFSILYYVFKPQNSPLVMF